MIGWALGWWQDKCDEYSDNHGWRDTSEPVPFGRARWKIAEWLNKRPDRCWSKLAEFGLGWTLEPGGKDVGYCRESAVKVGTCYCGKFIRADLSGEVDNISERIVVEP